MNRQRFFLTICALLAGASASLPQPPPPPLPPAPPIAPVAPLPPAPPLLGVDMDELREQADAFRYQFDQFKFDADAFRENALLAKEAALGGVFGRDRLAFFPQEFKVRGGRHDGDDRDY